MPLAFKVDAGTQAAADIVAPMQQEWDVFSSEGAEGAHVCAGDGGGQETKTLTLSFLC